jgi:hypothetical protein
VRHRTGRPRYQADRIFEVIRLDNSESSDRKCGLHVRTGAGLSPGAVVVAHLHGGPRDTDEGSVGPELSIVLVGGNADGLCRPFLALSISVSDRDELRHDRASSHVRRGAVLSAVSTYPGRERFTQHLLHVDPTPTRARVGVYGDLTERDDARMSHHARRTDVGGRDE